MLKKTILVIIGFCLGSVQSLAQDSKPETYFCTIEISAGLDYDDIAKRWKGAIFRPTQSFILHLKFLRKRMQKDIFNNDKFVTDYKVTAAKMGRTVAVPCVSRGKREVTVDERGLVECWWPYGRLTFNLRTKRFLEAYLLGYVDGVDNRNNTPSVSGGACTKIN